MKSLVLTLSMCVACLTVHAQHQHQPEAMKPAAPIAGLGDYHFPVSTGNAEAQRFFDQGLSLIYAFNHEESARAFRQAAKLDPNLAMAHWGIALAVGPNYNEPTIDGERLKIAVEAIQKARTLFDKATERERNYVDALARRFSPDPRADLKSLYIEYKNAMSELCRRYPDDLDAATLYADSLMNTNPWQLWTKEGKPEAGTDEIVAVLESVLRRNPDHIGANHLYIHAVEASPHPERALPSARRLETAAPAAGHLVHMPGHIYLRTGDYELSAKTNENAAEADRAYLKNSGAAGYYSAMYYSHNLHFLVESYGRMGLYREALRSAQQLEGHVRSLVKEMPMVEGFLPSAIFVKLRFARWDDVLKTPEPDASLRVTTVVWHYARGVAFAATGRVPEADKERNVFLESARNLPGETPFGLNSAASVLKVAASALDARIAWANRDMTAALAAWRKAIAAQEELNYDEPPGWYYSVRESFGAMLLMGGDAPGAEGVFRTDLRQNPRSGRSLFGLVESLKKQGKSGAAALVQREFERAWRNSDSKLRLEDL